MAHGHTATLDRVAGGLSGVAPPGGSRPAEGPVGKLVCFPPGLLLEPVVMPALRAGIAQAGPAARLIRDVVLEVGLARGPPADRAGAGGMPDLRQVPEPGSRFVARGLEPVITVLRTQRVKPDNEIRPVPGRPQPPGPVPARRPLPPVGGDAEPGRPVASRGGDAGPFRPVPGTARPSWFLPSPAPLGHGPGAAVRHRVA